jgi:phage terminase large subunit-like protein
MAAIIAQVPWMRARINVRRFTKEFEDIGEGGTGSYYCALSADADTKHGLSPSFWCYDEYGQAPDRKLFDVMQTAMGARAEPLGIVISTQAARDDAPLSQLIDYGQKVRAGDIKNPAFHLELTLRRRISILGLRRHGSWLTRL